MWQTTRSFRRTYSEAGVFRVAVVAREISIEATPRGQQSGDRPWRKTAPVQSADEAPDIVHLQIAQLCFAHAREKRIEVSLVTLRGMVAQPPFVREVPDVLLEQLL